MDVEFTVDLVKGKTIGWPRLETDTHFIVLGSEYEIANVVDPSFTVAAKVRKSQLPRK